MMQSVKIVRVFLEFMFLAFCGFKKVFFLLKLVKYVAAKKTVKVK